MVRLALLACLCAACGTEAPTPGNCPATPDPDRPHCDRYLPLVVGATWKYDVFDPSSGQKSRQKQLTIESEATIPGCAEALQTAPKSGFKMLRDEDYGFSYRWQSEVFLPDGTAEVFWERDENYNDGEVQPFRTICYEGRHRLYEDGSRPVFTEVFRELGMNHVDSVPIDRTVTQEWRVVSTGATKTVAGREFTDLLVISRTLTDEPSYTKEYWFARGIGKVYESSPPEEIEELTEWSIP